MRAVRSNHPSIISFLPSPFFFSLKIIHTNPSPPPPPRRKLHATKVPKLPLFSLPSPSPSPSPLISPHLTSPPLPSYPLFQTTPLNPPPPKKSRKNPRLHLNPLPQLQQRTRRSRQPHQIRRRRMERRWESESS